MCEACAPGSFAAFPAATACALCPAGTFSTSPAANSSRLCVPCLVGTYAFRATAPEDNLQAYFPFSPEGFLDDSSPNGWDLTPSDPPPTITSDCIFGSCANLSLAARGGESFRLRDLPIASLGGGASLSVCLWYVAEGPVRLAQTLFDFAAGRLSAARQYDSQDLIVRVYGGSRLAAYMVAKDGMRSGVWTHLCVTRSAGSSWSVFVNGTLLAAEDGSADAVLQSNWTSNTIGAAANTADCSGSAFLGRMKDFRIYSAALTPDEVFSLFSWRHVLSNATACTACSAGTFSTALSATSPAACRPCPAGTYSTADGASACVPCAAGKFSPAPGPIDSDACALCTPGTYAFSPSATACSACDAGMFSNAAGAWNNATCVACDVGTTSAAGSPSCRPCAVQEPCFLTTCPPDQYRSGRNCSACSRCANGSAPLLACSAYADAQCDPCAGAACGATQASIALTGFDSVTDFQVFGAAALKAGIAAGIGHGLSAANVIIKQVCQGTSCVVFRRLLASSVTATFQVIAAIDPSLVQAAVQSPNFTSVVSRRVTDSTGRNVTSSGAADLGVQCVAGSFQQGAGCAPCTVCDKYVLACGATFDARCDTSSGSSVSVTAAIAASVSTVVFVGLLVAGLAVYGQRLRAGASRRLIGAEKGAPANQRDLPMKLRHKYEAVRVVGSGSFGVVLEAWQLNNGKRVIQRAVKLVHATRRVFTDKEIRRLDREVGVQCLRRRHIGVLLYWGICVGIS
jgi:hypothetical protein